MLASFRKKRLHFYQGYLVIFAILAKTILSIGHGNALIQADNSGFFSSLCISSSVIQINISQDDAESESTDNFVVSADCPSCTQVQQEFVTVPSQQFLLSTQFKHTVTVVVDSKLLTSLSTHYQHIRAPPVIS